MLEEIVAAASLNRAASLAFALDRCARDKPVMVIMPRNEVAEMGRPSVHGFASWRRATVPLLIVTQTLAESLWTMEQALKSGALGGVMAAVEGATLTQTRRLDFAAKAGGTYGAILRSRSGGLSAARRRWRVAALTSIADRFDARAPGVPRLHVELVRQRDGPPGDWVLEYDAAAGGFAVAAGLAADRPREAQRRIPGSDEAERRIPGSDEAERRAA